MKKLGDGAIALTVVACSLGLFIALVFALQGNPFARPSRTLRVQLSDATGLQSSSLVKYAGATAGTVHHIRILPPAERAQSSHPENAVELTLAINPSVPPLTEGVVASVAADTLLSDKFLLLTAGDPKAPALVNNALIPGVAPVTFDALLRDLSEALASIRGILGTMEPGAMDDLLPRINQLLGRLDETVGQAQGLITHGSATLTGADGLVQQGRTLVANAGSLIDETRDPLKKLVSQLGSAADNLDQLARRADALVRTNSDDLTATARDARVAIAELKAAATSTRAFADSLLVRPQQLIWGPGRRPTPTPTPRPAN